MSPLHKVDVDLPLVYDLIHLRSWAKLGARVNASVTLYRQSMKDGLMAEGHQVNVISDAPPKERLREQRLAFLAVAPEQQETRIKLVREIVQLQKQFEERNQKAKFIRNQIIKMRCQTELRAAEAVANSTDVDQTEYQHLLAKRNKTDEERNKENKYSLKQRYGVEVTPQLKQRDDRGYYSQLLTHYYLTHEREYLRLRDKQEWNQQMERGEGKIFLPDLKTYTLKVEALKALGFLQLIDPDRELRETDSDLSEIKIQSIRCSKHIKRAIGISIPQETEEERITSIKIISRVLSLLGLKLKRVKQITCPEHRVKVYQIDPATLNDGRQTIFEVWQQRDTLALEIAATVGFYIPGAENCITPYRHLDILPL